MLLACKACLSCGDHCTVIGPSPVLSRTKNGTTIWSAFFNAVPRQDIVHAVTVLTEQFFKQSGCTVLSVELLSKSGHQGKPRGRTCSSFKHFWVEDIPLIVQVSFSTGILTAAGKCHLQKEGTCIGNQISPVLSGLPVLMAEQTFLKSLPFAVLSSLLFLRYVDNRRQPPDIGTVPYPSTPTDSKLLPPPNRYGQHQTVAEHLPGDPR